MTIVQARTLMIGTVLMLILTAPSYTRGTPLTLQTSNTTQTNVTTVTQSTPSSGTTNVAHTTQTNVSTAIDSNGSDQPTQQREARQSNEVTITQTSPTSGTSPTEDITIQTNTGSVNVTTESNQGDRSIRVTTLAGQGELPLQSAGVTVGTPTTLLLDPASAAPTSTVIPEPSTLLLLASGFIWLLRHAAQKMF